MVSKYYRGRVSVDKLLMMPMGFLHYLYYKAVQEAQSKDADTKAERQAEALEDIMEGGY